jgi:LmbE family N-acetylglucosaminyl deacetylase
MLAFAPHPDDAAIGCGGTILKLSKKNDITVVYMTSGEGGSISIPEKKLAKARELEAKNAAKVLGVKKTIFLRNPDGFLEFDKKNRQKVVSIIRKEKPEIVLTPYEQDLHRDHQKTTEIVLDSVWKASGPWLKNAGSKPWDVKSVLCYETWTPIQKPEHFENISKEISQKTRAIKCFKTQTKKIPYHEAAKGLNRYRGIMSGMGKYCEAFEIREG